MNRPLCVIGAFLAVGWCSDNLQAQVIQDSTTPYRTAIGSGALANTTGSENTASGFQALFSNTTGTGNTATGAWALRFSETAWGNTVNGSFSLHFNTQGSLNTATGIWSLYSSTTGYGNTANGAGALYSNNVGYYNTASGGYALFSSTGGVHNTAYGYSALRYLTGGSGNIAIGFEAGIDMTLGSNNILIGHKGKDGEAGAIRIGTEGYYTGGTYLAGVATTRHWDGGAVVGVTADGLLGTLPIANNVLTAGTVVGVTAEGLLGTLPAVSEPVSGSLLLLADGSAAPAGYTLLGTTSLSLTPPAGGRKTSVRVSIYQKQ